VLSISNRMYINLYSNTTLLYKIDLNKGTWQLHVSAFTNTETCSSIFVYLNTFYILMLGYKFIYFIN
jgi:hypothetical protein